MSDPGKASLTIRPPQILLERLGDPCIVVGFDIETHDWLDNVENTGHVGELGWYTMKHEASFLFDRIVQIGWPISAVGLDAPATTEALLVRPEGFMVAERATDIHKIPHETAAQTGHALVDVLQAFMQDVREAVAKGGRVVAHQIELLGERCRRAGRARRGQEPDANSCQRGP